MASLQFSANTPGERETLFINLYKKAFPAVAKYVNKKGGSFDEAKDIFQDALVIYYEKLADSSFMLRGGEQAYILGIAKHLWSKSFSESIKYTLLDNVEPPFEDENAISDQKVTRYLETAGQKCMEMLRAFYYDKLSVNTIARSFGFSTVHSASVQKYKCLEKIRETIKEKSLAYDDFIESN
ncbi:MAG: sigma-70 family RNA polymerase sigma factor [Bacteroidota bacterium]|nr:sigma-70 family RNA polymerase sigma factor [Bacteroidota bacterium]